MAQRCTGVALSLLLTLAFGCDEGFLWEVGSDPITLVDGGQPMDSGPRTDAGTSNDAGPSMDGGPAMDAGPGMDSGPAPDAGAPSPGCETAIEGEQRSITNAERTAAGLGPLACDEGMGRAARLHAQDMCTQGYFDHVSLDGRRFGDRMRAEGVMFGAGGENIARGQQTPQAVHTSWMNSSGHRANIMNTRYSRIGVGHDDCGGRPLWVQVFAD